MRLIDAERIPNDKFFEGMTDAEKAKVLQWFLTAPTVDAVEVVKCKDCKYWKTKNKKWSSYTTCTNAASAYKGYIIKNPEFFCYYGYIK